MLSVINSIRVQIGLPIKELEAEKGIKAAEGFFWGFPDGADTLKDGSFIFYEIEEGQQHPSTNVLKYWPVLEENNKMSIILIQWLIRKARSKNRWELSMFTGNKMMQAFPGRFEYVFLMLEDDANKEKLKELKNRIYNRI